MALETLGFGVSAPLVRLLQWRSSRRVPAWEFRHDGRGGDRPVPPFVFRPFRVSLPASSSFDETAEGLQIPPLLAPIEIVIVPIYRAEEGRARVLEAAEKVRAELPAWERRAPGKPRARPASRTRINPGPRASAWARPGTASPGGAGLSSPPARWPPSAPAGRPCSSPSPCRSRCGSSITARNRRRVRTRCSSLTRGTSFDR